MKTVLRKITRLSFALLLPTMLMMGCQEDLSEPDMAHPGKIKTKPAGQSKTDK